LSLKRWSHAWRDSAGRASSHPGKPNQDNHQTDRGDGAQRVLVVEQKMHQALELADAGYVLETGQLALSGPSRELMEGPLVRSAYLGVASG
jgi:hypothetical protein